MSVVDTFWSLGLFGGDRMAPVGQAEQTVTDEMLRDHAHACSECGLSSSGTAGNPWLVGPSGTSIAANAATIAEYRAITPDDRVMVTLPLFCSLGLSVLNSHLAAGATLILTDRSIVDPQVRRIAVGTRRRVLRAASPGHDARLQIGGKAATGPGISLERAMVRRRDGSRDSACRTGRLRHRKMPAWTRSEGPGTILAEGYCPSGEVN